MLSSCQVASTRKAVAATFRVPRSSMALTVERKAAHPFLAEYDRYLILLIDGIERQRIELSTDTGGYSRVNVFRINDNIYLLKDIYNIYELDLRQQALRKSPNHDLVGAFVGAFDDDGEKVWRFIPASDRAQVPTDEL